MLLFFGIMAEIRCNENKQKHL